MIDQASIESLTQRDWSFFFDTRWGNAGDETRDGLLRGGINWAARYRTFDLAFLEADRARLFAGNAESFSSSRSDGEFYDPNRISCRVDASAVKVTT